ncbi:hypothetical protein R2601_02983 [Salipiger bermudensis HTCC2601]|uniref:Uncharacterized protein n=1 Tax=Salipiger bermudensis (strain DSM 26914 / JCM 13377 / KCTC 12554 / HTCC2601) TaxID=314265 RepID=Q0FWP9_SALBH|nr:hypothetical protein R2601_02983 [Salipiger bermudensis HTCC2601]
MSVSRPSEPLASVRPPPAAR